MRFWLQRGAHFCKNMKIKCIRAEKSPKMHLANYILDASSQQGLHKPYKCKCGTCCRFSNRARRLKTHKSQAKIKILMGSRSEKLLSERPKKRQEQTKSETMLFLRPFDGQKSKFCSLKMVEVVLQNNASGPSGKHHFGKVTFEK